MPDNIYDFIELYKKSDDRDYRIVGAIFDDLNDRRGIKQELQAIDADILDELFKTVVFYLRETK